MSYYAPSWAFGAQALDSGTDPHLAKGVHLRLLGGSALGLPLLPLQVFRVKLGMAEPSPVFRSDQLRMIDSQGRVVSPPGSVVEGNPITVYLPPPPQGVCVCAEVLASPLPDGPGIRVQAQVSNGHGFVTVASSSTVPLVVSASRIDRLVITGAGRFMGVRWLDSRRLNPYFEDVPWRVWSLPLAQRHLHTPAPSALADATARVRRGAPLREPLYKAIYVASPAAAPAIPNAANVEEQRVNAARLRPQGWLDALLAAGSMAQGRRVATESTGGAQPVTIEMNLLEALGIATLDPGLARWAGFGDVDEAPLTGQTGEVVAYVIRGIWRWGQGRVEDSDLLATLAGGRLDSMAALNAIKGTTLALPPGATPPFLDLYTVACATVGKGSNPPQAPLIDSFDRRPFLPALPPLARREVVLNVSGLVPGPGAALGRQASGSWVSLNPKVNGQPVGLVVGKPAESLKAGTGRIADRQAPAEATTYRLAQCDVFGRWSPWRSDTALPIDRPQPPAPVLQLGYQPPLPERWKETGPLAGKLNITVPVPRNDTLAPGSLPLSVLELKVGNTTVNALPGQANSAGNLVLQMDGPALPPCGKGEAVVSARWLAGNLASTLQTTKRIVHDPRPPQPVQLAATLDYASRPDATGRSRVDLRWPMQAGQSRYNVYCASETTLRAFLQGQAGPMPADLNSSDVVKRAAAFRQCSAKLPRASFELLKMEPQSIGGNQMRVVHEVSGQLATLGFYRVTAVSAANVESAFDTSPMVAYAVPVLNAPAQPLLSAQQDANTLAVTLTLRVPRGPVPAARYRLRRSSGSAAEANAMRVVAEGPVRAAAAAEDTQQVLIDAGALQPWRRYAWRVEVRGADLPGTPPGRPLRGDWSAASAAAEVLLVPAGAPQPVQLVGADVGGGKTVITVKHVPTDLQGGAVGRFRLELYRQAPRQRELCVCTLWCDTPAAQGGFNAQGEARLEDAHTPEPGTAYRVLVVDPLERTSAGSPVITLMQGA